MPDYDNRIELVILGSMLMKPELLEYGCATLLEEDFFDGNGRKLFKVLADMKSSGEHVDQFSVISPAEKAGVDSMFSLKCFDAYTDVVYLDDKVKDRMFELIQLSDRRFAYIELQHALKEVRAGKLTDSVLISTRLKQIADEIVNRHRQNGNDFIGEDAKYVLNRRAAARKGRIDFGVRSIDALLNGMGKGHLVIVAARPSVGKSAISLQPAIATARTGDRVHVATIEMTSDEVAERVLSMLSGVPTAAMVGERAPTAVEAENLIKAITELVRLPVTIDDASSTPSDIERAFIAAKNGGKPIRLMIIDYFGLMKADRPRYKRHEEMSEISKELKRLAKRYEATVVLLSQISRDVDRYTQPTMEMLRETGSLEQDADKIITLWVDRTQPDLTHFAIEKNRQGQIGKGVLRFDGSVMRYSEVEEENDGGVLGYMERLER